MGSHCNVRETECAQLTGEETKGGAKAVLRSPTFNVEQGEDDEHGVSSHAAQQVEHRMQIGRA